jgi:hypothetical protein
VHLVTKGKDGLLRSVDMVAKCLDTPTSDKAGACGEKTKTYETSILSVEWRRRESVARATSASVDQGPYSCIVRILQVSMA